MKSPKWIVVWGCLLVYAGALMLLESINSLQVSPYLWAGLFLVGGLAFAVGFAESPARWWAAIPAGFMLGLAAMIVWNHLRAGPPDRWGTSIFFGGIGLGFLAVRARASAYGWAILPAGLALTLSLFIGLTSVLTQSAAMAVFFFGIAATFVALASQPATGKGLLRWPFIPAIVFGVLGAFFAFDAARRLEPLNVIVPLALIAGGAFMILRVFVTHPRT